MSDELAWIQAAQKGDLEAFNQLVLASQDAVYHVAYRILGERAAAEDATQEAFLKAWQAIGRYRGGSWRAWLFRIVTNVCYDHLRRRKRRPTVPLEPADSDGEAVESPAWLADTDPSGDPEAQAERTALRQALEACLQQLPPEHRAVVVLIDMEGFAYAEAAHALGVRLGTLKSRLARARLRMQRCLQRFPELLGVFARLKHGDASQ
ncbi:MAG: RNA polymerase sigma factor [Chloroflexi bacterium]|nr:RNA polymerase sigma factor [Chloroflexota bacterium]